LRGDRNLERLPKLLNYSMALLTYDTLVPLGRDVTSLADNKIKIHPITNPYFEMNWSC